MIFAELPEEKGEVTTVEENRPEEQLLLWRLKVRFDGRLVTQRTSYTCPTDGDEMLCIRDNMKLNDAVSKFIISTKRFNIY